MQNKQSNSWKIVFIMLSVVTGVIFVWWFVAALSKNSEKWQELSARIRSSLDDAHDAKDFAHKRLNYWKRHAQHELRPVMKAVNKSLQKVERELQSQSKPAAKKMQSVVSQVREVLSESEEGFGLNQRQEQIYQIIKRAKQASINSFATQVADVTPRTLRRDLTRLEKLGLVEQVGKTKDSFYRLKN